MLKGIGGGERRSRDTPRIGASPPKERWHLINSLQCVSTAFGEFGENGDTQAPLAAFVRLLGYNGRVRGPYLRREPIKLFPDGEGWTNQLDFAQYKIVTAGGSIRLKFTRIMSAHCMSRQHPPKKYALSSWSLEKGGGMQRNTKTA